MRVNQAQEFVIGGYTRAFDALIFGYYDGSHLLYAAPTRNGFGAIDRETTDDRPRLPSASGPCGHAAGGCFARSVVV
jgi:hypothetical protein